MKTVTPRTLSLSPFKEIFYIFYIYLLLSVHNVTMGHSHCSSLLKIQQLHTKSGMCTCSLRSTMSKDMRRKTHHCIFKEVDWPKRNWKSSWSALSGKRRHRDIETCIKTTAVVLTAVWIPLDYGSLSSPVVVRLMPSTSSYSYFMCV